MQRMAGVRVKENEPIESAIRRFKKQCEKAGILAELRKREHYEKPSVRRKKKAMAAQPLGWAFVFVGTWVVAALLGRIAERLASALLLGGFNRVAGMLFGSAKAAALMGFTLLLIERAAPASAVSQKIAESRLGRPLEHMAGTVAEAGHAPGILPGGQHA